MINKIMFQVYKNIANSFYGTGVSKIPFIRNAHKMLTRQLKPTYIDIFGYKMYLDSKDEICTSINGDKETLKC